MQLTQAAINLRKRDVDIVTVGRQIRGQRDSGRVFHEFRIERAADDHGGETVFENQLRERDGWLGQTVSAQTRDDVNHGRVGGLQPEREL